MAPEFPTSRQPNTSELFGHLFPDFYTGLNSDIPLPQEIIFPQYWANTLKKVGELTSQDGNERLVAIHYDTRSKQADLYKLDEWSQRGTSISPSLARAAYSHSKYPIRTIGLGHSHPHPIGKRDRQIWVEYNRPESSAFLSPGDILFFLKRYEIPALFFAFDSSRMMLAIKSDQTVKPELSITTFLLKEFYAQSRKSYKPTFRAKQNTLGGTLERVLNVVNLKMHSLNPNFDIFGWNILMAQKYKFHLYQGDFSVLKKVN